MQRLKTAIKRMAAIGAGVAMLGATMTSAVALDLADYPAPFVDANGVFDDSTAIVVGGSAAASDTLGAVDIATNLQFMAKTPVSGGSGTVNVVGGVTEDVPIGMGIANSTSVALDWQMTDNDISSFTDTVISFQGADYDVHDEFTLSKTSPSIETSLTSSDDDYESGIFMEVLKDSIKYYYVFDDAINVSTVTTSEPLEISFLGKTLKMTSVASSGTEFTAYVGSEFFMDVGDVVTIEGKKVTLSNVGSGGAIVIDVDGTIETIPASTTETVNGIEVTNDETFYADAKEERSASLVVGIDAQSTYKDGDAYVGEDTSDPDWVWDIGSLKGAGTEASTTISQATAGTISVSGPKIGIENDFIMDDDSDNPPGVGECLDLPNNYASVCFDSLTIPDEDYLTLTIEYASGEDTGEANSPYGGSSSKTIHIHTPVEETLIIPKTSDAIGVQELNASIADSDIKTNEVWLQRSCNDCLGYALFYKDSNHVPSTRFWGRFALGNDTTENNTLGAHFLRMNYESTKDDNIKFRMTNATLPGATSGINMWLDVTGDSTSELDSDTDDIVMNWSVASGNFSSLGATISKEEAGELQYATRNRGIPINATLTGLGTKDEDHRTKYGIIIKDPKSNGASDKVVLEIPSDDLQTNIVVKGQATTVSSAASSYIPADITIDTKLDSEVANAASHNLILVGGPVVNSLTAQFMGTDWTLASGEALIKLVSNGENVALVVAGTDAMDTRMAAKVIANYADYSLETTESVVTGTLSAPSIKVA